DLLRSSAVPILPAAAELLKDLSGVLARWGGWYLFGAQAVIAHGVPRLSADVDVTLRMTPEDPERFAHQMARLIVPLIDIEDLIIAKVLAGRTKDLDDARNLWSARGRDVDPQRIRRILRLLEE